MDAILRESQLVELCSIGKLQRDDATGALPILLPALQKFERLSAAGLNLQAGMSSNKEQLVPRRLGQRDECHSKSYHLENQKPRSNRLQ